MTVSQSSYGVSPTAHPYPNYIEYIQYSMVSYPLLFVHTRVIAGSFSSLGTTLDLGKKSKFDSRSATLEISRASLRTASRNLSLLGATTGSSRKPHRRSVTISPTLGSFFENLESPCASECYTTESAPGYPAISVYNTGSRCLSHVKMQ